MWSIATGNDISGNLTVPEQAVHKTELPLQRFHIPKWKL